MGKVILGMLLLFSLSAFSQQKDTLSKNIPPQKKDLLSLSKVTLSGYGVVNYYHYGKYDTDKNIKDKIDAERLNLYLGYIFTDKIRLKTEIEFEHGGTGSTIELDTQEEFGEYEQEIEAGGEVKLEQIHIDYQIKPYFGIRVGRMKLHFNLAQNLDRPTSYFTTHRQEMENEILPLGWYENGIQFYGTFSKQKLIYEVSFTNGLDATGFSSRGWIKEGYQSRFEMSVAESVAITGRLDYKFGTHKQTYAGISGYINNTSPNRPKNDLDVPAYITIVEAHINHNEKNLRFSSVFLYGNLQNSDVVSRKNATLSNNLGVKRTPVGQKMIGASTEIGYEIMHLLKPASPFKLYPFVRVEYYDTMYKTEGVVVRKPRWERTGLMGGINWFLTDQIVFKAHYQSRVLGSNHFDLVTSLDTGKRQKENTLSAGIGFSF